MGHDKTNVLTESVREKRKGMRVFIVSTRQTYPPFAVVFHTGGDDR